MKSVWLALIMMVSVGVGVTIDKLAAVNVEPLPLLLVRTFIFFFLILGATLLFGKMPQVWTLSQVGLSWIIVSAVIAVVALTSYYAALQSGSATVVGTIIAAAPIITFLVAFLFLREGFSWWRLLGVLITVAGLIIVSRS